MESTAAPPRIAYASFRFGTDIPVLGAWSSGFLLVALLAGNAGGFFPAAWAWTAFSTWFAVVVVIALRPRLDLAAIDLIMIGGAVAFAGWFALSIIWSRSIPSTFDESFRLLAYAGIVAAASIVVERRTVPHLLGGITTATVLLSLYALGTRLLPDRLGSFESVLGYRLVGTIGYWNGLGLFAVSGLILALGFALRGERLATRVSAGTALPILATTAYFTFSRGAWLALLAGFVAAFVIDRRRLQFAFGSAVLGLGPAIGILLASRSGGLTQQGATFASAVDEGHRLAWALVLLMAFSASLAVLLWLAERRIQVPSLLRTAWAVVLVVTVLAGMGAAWSRAGSPSPVGLGERTWHRVQATPTASSNQDRLFELSANGRLGFWHTAWDTFADHPVVGVGGGTFWQAWVASPRGYYASTEAHSVYAETLAELGIVGLLLLLLVLTPPVAGAIRARRSPLVPFAFAAFAGWVVHSGVDWDWELMGVTAPALICGVAVVASGRGRPRRVHPWLRWVAVAAAGLLAVVASTGVVTSARLASAQTALQRGDLATAAEAAHDARRFAPWSTRPLELEAAVRLDQGRQSDARATYRAIVERDPESWVAWAHLGAVTTGRARERAVAAAHALNPHYRGP